MNQSMCAKHSAIHPHRLALLARVSSVVDRLALALLLLAAGCAEAPSGSVGDAASVAPTDVLSARGAESDGGAVALPDSTVRRLVAADPLWAEALRIHYDAVVVDLHLDTPMHLVDDGVRLAERAAPRPASRHADGPRLREGGLDAPFFSVYVARSYGEDSAAVDRARALLTEAQRQVAALPSAESARTAADVLRIAQSGRTAVLYGLEGGHALAGRAAVLRELAGRGVRYVTLTHANTNTWADSATDAPRWDGLNGLGRELVAEMNRLGVLVDLSHTSDATFWDALDASAAPPILSHSSCRALHDMPRNASDAMLRALADAGGVVFVNAYPGALAEGPATLSDYLDHIEHALAVAGPHAVGIGSDWDGVPAMPAGLADVTRLPHVTYGLLRRGHTEATVRAVLGGNALRVLRAAERAAAG